MKSVDQMYFKRMCLVLYCVYIVRMLLQVPVLRCKSQSDLYLAYSVYDACLEDITPSALTINGSFTSSLRHNSVCVCVSLQGKLCVCHNSVCVCVNAG